MSLNCMEQSRRKATIALKLKPDRRRVFCMSVSAATEGIGASIFLVCGGRRAHVGCRRWATSADDFVGGEYRPS